MNKKEMIDLLEQLDVPDDTPIGTYSDFGFETILDVRVCTIDDQPNKTESFTAIVID